MCRSEARDHATICVVEAPQHVAALERLRFRGVYHVLHGAIDPLHGVFEADLGVPQLLRRLEGGAVREVVLATPADPEGDTTATVLLRAIHRANPGVAVTRLAWGRPSTGDTGQPRGL